MAWTQLSNFNWFYFIAKLNGMVPFNWSDHKAKASKSLASTLYCIVLTFALTYCMCSFQIDILTHLQVSEDKMVSILVFLFQVTVSTCRTLWIFLFQLYYRRRYIIFINKAVKMHRNISKTLSDHKDISFLDEKSRKMYLCKGYTSWIQVVVLSLCVFDFARHYPEVEGVMKFALVVYTHMVKALFSCFFFGSMLAILQFFRHINEKAVELMRQIAILNVATHQMRMQTFCNLSDEIDRMATLYVSVSELMGQLIKMFSMSLAFGFMDAFLIILSKIYNMYSDEIKQLSTISAADTILKFVNQFSFITFYCIELYSVVNISRQVMNEGKRTAEVLHGQLNYGVDVRLQQSVSFTCFCISLNVMVPIIWCQRAMIIEYYMLVS